MNDTFEGQSETVDGKPENEMKSHTNKVKDSAECLLTSNVPASGGNDDEEPEASKPERGESVGPGNNDATEYKLQSAETSASERLVDILSEVTDCEYALSIAEGFMGQASELIGFVVDGDDAEFDKQSELKKILSSLEDAISAVKKGIELNEKEKFTEDIDAISISVKKLGYNDLDDFLSKLGYSRNANPVDEKCASMNFTAQPQAAPSTNKKADAPYDCLLKEEFNGTGKPDFTKGYYKRYGIKPITGWVKDFNREHGRPPNPEDCRDATLEEKEAMLIANKHSFDSIKRRSRSPKK